MRNISLKAAKEFYQRAHAMRTLQVVFCGTGDWNDECLWQLGSGFSRAQRRVDVIGIRLCATLCSDSSDVNPQLNQQGGS